MKSKLPMLFSVLFMLIASVTFGQYSIDYSTAVNSFNVLYSDNELDRCKINDPHKQLQENEYTSDDMKVLQLGLMEYPYGSFLNLDPDKCASYTRMRKAGNTLFFVGLASMGAGLILITGGTVYDQKAPFYIGLVLTTIGGAALAAGIPLKIVGKNKSKQYCNGTSGMLNLKPSKNGLALQYQF